VTTAIVGTLGVLVEGHTAMLVFLISGVVLGQVTVSIIWKLQETQKVNNNQLPDVMALLTHPQHLQVQVHTTLFIPANYSIGLKLSHLPIQLVIKQF